MGNTISMRQRIIYTNADGYAGADLPDNLTGARLQHEILVRANIPCVGRTGEGSLGRVTLAARPTAPMAPADANNRFAINVRAVAGQVEWPSEVFGVVTGAGIFLGTFCLTAAALPAALLGILAGGSVYVVLTQANRGLDRQYRHAERSLRHTLGTTAALGEQRRHYPAYLETPDFEIVTRPRPSAPGIPFELFEGDNVPSDGEMAYQNFMWASRRQR